jgi:hypothetical protein
VTKTELDYKVIQVLAWIGALGLVVFTAGLAAIPLGIWLFWRRQMRRSEPATERQLEYLRDLCAQRGLDWKLEGLTVQEASGRIDEALKISRVRR